VFEAIHSGLKYFLSILFLICWTSYLVAQDGKTSVLKKQIKATTGEKDKIRLYFELGRQFEEIDLDSCLHFLTQSLTIAQKNHDDQSSAKAMSRIGYTYIYHANDEDKALQWLNRAIQLAKPKNDYLNLALCYQYLGIISMHQGFGNPYDLFDLALNSAIKANDWKEISTCYEVISLYFRTKVDYKKAEEAYLMAMKISKKHDLDMWISQGIDYCDLLENQRKYTQSFLFAKKLYVFKDKLKMTKGYFVYVNDLGRLETKLKNYAKAEGIFLKILNEEKQKSKIDTLHLYHIFKHLEILYLVQGDYKKTYQASKNFNYISQWLARKRQTQNSKLALLKVKSALDLEKKEVEITLLAEQQNKQLLFLLAAIMIAMLMTGFVITLQRNKKKIEQQKLELSQLNTTKDRLFSIIAHDLRGPITTFKGILSLLGDDSLSQKEFIDLSKPLNQSVDNLHAMLDNLLLWSFSQMNGLKPQMKTLKVGEFLNEAINLVQEIAKGKNIDIQREISAGLTIFADENNMSTIVGNLINNALKFTAQHGKILIKAYQQNNWVKLEIIDSGVGIKPEELSTLFSFPKLKTGTAGEKGTGLGLILCNELIEQNGGKISVASEYGNGTSFTITLPVG